MKTCRKTIKLLLAAAAIAAISSGVPALGQIAQDDSAAAAPSPRPAESVDQTSAATPVEVKRGIGPLLRILLWTGKSGSPLEKALAELIVKQAFEEDGIYYRTSASSADFADQAASGLFNVFVLFEADERLENLDALRDQVSRGKSVIIIGSEDQSRLLSEFFGFHVREGSSRDGGSSLAFTGDPVLGLGGTIPVSGPLLLPQKPGAAPAAVYSDSRKPAVLIDAIGSGRAIVMPFSIIRSAREAGTTPVYSPLLRAAVRSAAPEGTDQGKVLSEELTVTSSVDHVRTRLLVTLPQGARPLGASPDGTLRNNTVLFELTAEQYPKKLQYLYEQPGGGNARPLVELFYESDGKMVSGGKIE
jgi:hypothetical protein